jgi:hypothetical protein
MRSYTQKFLRKKNNKKFVFLHCHSLVRFRHPINRRESFRFPEELVQRLSLWLRRHFLLRPFALQPPLFQLTMSVGVVVWRTFRFRVDWRVGSVSRCQDRVLLFGQLQLLLCRKSDGQLKRSFLRWAHFIKK